MEMPPLVRDSVGGVLEHAELAGKALRMSPSLPVSVRSVQQRCDGHGQLCAARSVRRRPDLGGARRGDGEFVAGEISALGERAE